MINDEYASKPETLKEPVRAPEELNTDKSALLIACMIAVLLVMAILTSYYFPRTYGEIVGCKEVYPGNKPFTFIVELGLDEYWHVKSWTDTEGTNFNVTLTGYPIIGGSETEILENNSFTYSWTLSLNSPSTYVSDEFDLKIPRSSSKWTFNILIEGYGSINILITKFDRHNFYMFFIPDVIGTVIIFVIIILIVKQKTRLETNTYQFPIRARNS